MDNREMQLSEGDEHDEFADDREQIADSIVMGVSDY